MCVDHSGPQMLGKCQWGGVGLAGDGAAWASQAPAEVMDLEMLQKLQIPRQATVRVPHPVSMARG